MTMAAPRLIGHRAVADSLWRMVEEERLPQTLLFAGPAGVGKATLARHLAAGINCVSGPGKPCGDCSSCQRILATDLSSEPYRQMFEERRKLPAAKRSETPLVIATHPDFLIFPPDGPMHVISIDQARLLRRSARFGPSEGRRRIFVLEHAERANVEAANALLKTLEEPSSELTVVLTSENPQLLPATIRSRAIPMYFSALSNEEMESFLRMRSDIPPTIREHIGAWAQGSPGVALSLNVEDFLRRRQAMLALLKTALSNGEFAVLSGELGALARKQSEGIDRLSSMLTSLLRDLLRLHLKIEEGLVHRDIAGELSQLARQSDFAWTQRAAAALDHLEKLQPTNIQRQIALEAFALTLQQ